MIINRIRTLVMTGVLVLFSVAPAVAILPLAGTASAQCNNKIANNVANGASTAATGNNGNINCNTSNTTVGNTLAKIANEVVNIFSIVVGAVSIIMIIYGGFRYITSGGSSENVGNAKNIIIYAIIGLIIVALAQLIVHLTLSVTAQNTTGFNNP